jgi:hypothetical protein
VPGLLLGWREGPDLPIHVPLTQKLVHGLPGLFAQNQHPSAEVSVGQVVQKPSPSKRGGDREAVNRLLEEGTAPNNAPARGLEKVSVPDGVGEAHPREGDLRREEGMTARKDLGGGSKEGAK